MPGMLGYNTHMNINDEYRAKERQQLLILFALVLFGIGLVAIGFHFMCIFVIGFGIMTAMCCASQIAVMLFFD